MEIRTPQNLGAAARGRRQVLKLSQATVAEAAGVSRPWLSEFESGKPTVEIGRVLAVLSVLDLALDVRPADEKSASDELPDLDTLLDDYANGRNV